MLSLQYCLLDAKRLELNQEMLPALCREEVVQAPCSGTGQRPGGLSSVPAITLSEAANLLEAALGRERCSGSPPPLGLECSV